MPSQEAVVIWLRAIGFVTGATLFWVQYFDLKDKLSPEPRKMMGLSYLLGFVAAGFALLVYRMVEAFGGPEEPGHVRSHILLYCFLLVGPVEEGCKFLFARLLIFRSVHFDEPIDGMIYSSSVSIGFASVESLIHSQFLPWPHQLARALTAPLTHSLFASVWGFGTGYAFFHTRNVFMRFVLPLLTLTASALIHGFYDYLLLAYDATFIASGIALFLWAFLIYYARRIVYTKALPAGETDRLQLK